MSDLRRITFTCVPIAMVLLLTAGWKLATLDDRPPITRKVSPTENARFLLEEAKKASTTDRDLARYYCDEGIAIIDSERARVGDPEPGKNWDFEEVQERLFALKITLR
jgi:hypothetical protein